MSFVHFGTSGIMFMPFTACITTSLIYVLESLFPLRRKIFCGWEYYFFQTERTGSDLCFCLNEAIAFISVVLEKKAVYKNGTLFIVKAITVGIISDYISTFHLMKLFVVVN